MIASLLSVARNDNFDYIHAFSYALKNQFEIISRNENYAFNHNNFYHNGNNRIWRLPRLLAKGTPTETKSRNDDFIVCNNGLLSINNGLFSRNDYGGNFIFGFWSNSNFGFLFNRKINSKKNFISEGEKTMKKIFLTNLKETIWEAVQVKAQSIYQIAYVYHRLYFINGKLSKIKLANKKHALAFISNKISRIFFSALAKKSINSNQGGIYFKLKTKN